MGWRPGNWKKKAYPYQGIPVHKAGAIARWEEAHEIGADAMHKADVDFLRIFYPSLYFQIQASMTKEQFEA
jgi:hypothetical protein